MMESTEIHKLLAENIYKKPVNYLKNQCSDLSKSSNGQFMNSIHIFDPLDFFKNIDKNDFFSCLDLKIISIQGQAFKTLDFYLNSLFCQIYKINKSFFNIKDVLPNSSTNKLALLNSVLENLHQTGEKIMLVFCNFELFSDPDLQSFVYTIFDCVKSFKNVPVNILTISSRCEPHENFEKRLKSRIGKNKLNMLPNLDHESIANFLREVLCSSKIFGKKRLAASKLKEFEKSTSYANVIQALSNYSSFGQISKILNSLSFKMKADELDQIESNTLQSCLDQIYEPMMNLNLLSNTEIFILASIYCFSLRNEEKPFTCKAIYDHYYNATLKFDLQSKLDYSNFIKFFRNLIEIGFILVDEKLNENSTEFTDNSYCLIVHEALKNLENFAKNSKCPSVVESWLKDHVK